MMLYIHGRNRQGVRFKYYFHSYTIFNEQNALIPNLSTATVNTPLNNIELSPLEVESVLQTFPVAKASDPNSLSNRLLRELSKDLSSSYCSLFNQSLCQGIVPSLYKEASVSPIPKKGDLSDVSNYRLISLLNLVEKGLERLVFKYLYNHLRHDNLLSALQLAFFLETQLSIS